MLGPALELKEKLRELGFDFPQSSTPIISLTYENEKKHQKLFQLLLQNGIYPSFLNYPGSPPGGHFRFALSSLHSQEHIDLLYHTISMSL
jgi:7-keto-8-aminopelargonate synthetase-like enzyme